MVGLLRTLHEGVKFDKSIGTAGWGEVLGGGVGGCEFGGQVGEVGEGKFAGVGVVADGEEAELVLYQIAAVPLKKSVIASSQTGERVV